MGLRVFVLEDDRMLQGVLRDWLERHQHEVVTFADADSFCRAVAECRCTEQQRCGDIMICDQRLPGITGIDLIRHLRGKGCKVPRVALMSGWWNEQSLAEAAKLGITVFHKPRELGRILEWLRDCAETHDPGRDLMPHFSETKPRPVRKDLFG